MLELRDNNLFLKYMFQVYNNSISKEILFYFYLYNENKY